MPSRDPQVTARYKQDYRKAQKILKDKFPEDWVEIKKTEKDYSKAIGLLVKQNNSVFQEILHSIVPPWFDTKPQKLRSLIEELYVITDECSDEIRFKVNELYKLVDNTRFRT